MVDVIGVRGFAGGQFRNSRSTSEPRPSLQGTAHLCVDLITDRSVAKLVLDMFVDNPDFLERVKVPSFLIPTPPPAPRTILSASSSWPHLKNIPFFFPTPPTGPFSY